MHDVNGTSHATNTDYWLNRQLCTKSLGLAHIVVYPERTNKIQNRSQTKNDEILNLGPHSVDYEVGYFWGTLRLAFR
jgi:hypothetical protein